MRSWNHKNSASSKSKQPLLPGLFGAFDGAPPKRKNRRAQTPGEAALLLARRRFALVSLGFALFFLIATGRMAFLTVGKEPLEPPVILADSGQKPATARADIVDRNGTLLATSLPTVTLLADAKKVLDIKEAAQKITSVLTDMEAEKIERDLREARRYLTIRRQLTPRQYYAINKLGIAGLEFVPDESRVYPAGPVTAHVLGYTDVDNIGIAGLEKSLNARLQTEPAPIATTLDLRLQSVLHRELSEAIKEYDAIGAAGVIMDATNGEILSLVSLPDFDPQNPGTASADAKFNRSTLGVYEMGSTFKIFNTAMALDSGLIRAGERFDTTHPIEIGGKRIRDFHSVDRWLNVAEIFMESSNIGSARMADRLGAEKQRAFLRRLGLMDKASIELPEVGAPIVPSAENWRETTTMTVSFGHGIAVNAIQLAAASAAIINEGVAVKPTLLKKAADAKKQKEPAERVISEKTSAQLRALMRLVVKEGTAKKAEVQGYLVGGKTGTADKLSGRRYSENARISSFIGIFPAHAPRYIVFALLDDPKGNAKTHGFATGGWTAAPVVGKVIGQIGPLLNLPPVEQDVLAATEHQLLRPLGGDVLDSLNLKKETDNYAALESNNVR